MSASVGSLLRSMSRTNCRRSASWMASSTRRPCADAGSMFSNCAAALLMLARQPCESTAKTPSVMLDRMVSNSPRCFVIVAIRSWSCEAISLRAFARSSSSVTPLPARGVELSGGEEPGGPLHPHDRLTDASRNQQAQKGGHQGNEQRRPGDTGIDTLQRLVDRRESPWRSGRLRRAVRSAPRGSRHTSFWCRASGSGVPSVRTRREEPR